MTKSYTKYHPDADYTPNDIGPPESNNRMTKEEMWQLVGGEHELTYYKTMEEDKQSEIEAARERMRAVNLKHTLRIPTHEQYAYIESEFEGTSEQAVALYRYITSLINK